MKKGKTIAFVGTRNKLTPYQKGEVSRVLADFKPRLVLHGGGGRAAADFHALALGLCPIEVYPAERQALQPLAGDRSDVVMQSRQPRLDRDHELVDGCDLLIVCVSTNTQDNCRLRLLIRRARDASRQVELILAAPYASRFIGTAKDIAFD